eukprot:441092-Amphidinium_carterae.1
MTFRITTLDRGKSIIRLNNKNPACAFRWHFRSLYSIVCYVSEVMLVITVKVSGNPTPKPQFEYGRAQP